MPAHAPVSPAPPPDTHRQYAQLLASIDGIVWEADARTFHFTFVSEQAERLLGYPLADWLEPNFWTDHLHPDDREWAVELCDRATREKRLHDFEYRMIAADGRVVWLRDIVTVVVEDDEPSKLRGVMVDVTEKKRVEEERLEHVRFLESLDRVNRAIQGAADVDAMMRDVLDAVLGVFGCDRAWLVYPCDPDAPTWQAVMERTRPEYPGAFQAGVELPVHADVAELYRTMWAAGQPVSFGPGSSHPLPREAAALFGIRSQLCLAVFPKVDRPYLFGIHQCSHPREWSASERRLFQEIGRRLCDALTTLLVYRRLHASEARFRTFVDHATDAFFLHDADGVILDVNRQACECLGYTRDELVGETPALFDVGLDRAAIGRVNARLSAGEVFTFDTRHRRKDGTTFPVEVRARPFLEGGTRYGISLARDITERKKAEEALAAREAELRNLAESSPGLMGTYHARPDGTVCMPYTSPRIWELFGLQPEDVADDATPLLNRTHPDDLAGVRETIAESARTMTPWRHEYRVLHPTRGELWLEGNSTPKPHPAGGVIWYGFVHDITDRKRTEERRRLVEERFRLVWSQSGDGMRLSDADGTVLMVNDAFCRLVGLPRGSLEGHSLAVIQLPELRERVVRLHRERFDSRTVPARMQRSLTLWNGTQVWVELTNTFLEGDRPLLLSIFRDVSEQKRAEEALRESERRLDAAQRMAHVAWWERNFVTGRATRSHESYRMFGLAPAEWDDLPAWDSKWRERIHPDDVGRTTAALHRAFEGGPRYDLEYRVVWPDGQVRVVHSQGDVTFDPDGRPLRMFGTMQDITELRHAEDDLRASEARFRTFVDHATDAFFLHDRDATVLDVNRQACASLGYTRDELIGLHPTAFDAILDATAVEAFAARLDAGEVLAFETSYRRKDGTTFPVEVRTRPFREGGKRHAVSLARDVTDRKRLEEQFRQAQKMEAVGLLAGGVAHDFNNLLTVINCYAEMVFGRLSPGDPNRGLVAEVQKSGERAASLTRQLLAFSRKQVLLPQVVSANALIDELAKMLRRLIGEDVELALDLDPHLGVTQVDPGQFEQAVINLVVNARDAMPGGGRVTVATRNVDRPTPAADVPPGAYVSVSVSDTGHGMDEATQARIFEPFFTTKGVGRGTGLGLAMVYGFVKQSGGHVEVVSEVGLGTTFRVYLPRVEAAAPAGRPSRSHLLVPTGSETVLLVEDDDSVRDLSRTILESCGYKVLEARDGEHGAAVARQAGRIDLLVTDLVMPRMSGRQLADELLAVRPTLRVLFLSGYTDEAVLTRGVDTADIAFLHKPFTVTSLAHKVREVLDAESE